MAALVPKAELDGDIGDHHIALQARLMSQALRKLTGTISKTKCLLVFINQVRQKVGVIFGSNEVTTGGTALRFYSSVRLEIRRGQKLKAEGEDVGVRTRVKVVKNKLAPPFGLVRRWPAVRRVLSVCWGLTERVLGRRPFIHTAHARQAEFDMLFGSGVDLRGEVLDLAVQLGLVAKSGAWFSLNELELPPLEEGATAVEEGAVGEFPIMMGQGREKVRGCCCRWCDGQRGRASAFSSCGRPPCFSS